MPLLDALADIGHRPAHLLADKAYSHPSTRRELRRRRIRHTIPESRDQVEHRKAKGSSGGRPPRLDLSATASATPSSAASAGSSSGAASQPGTTSTPAPTSAVSSSPPSSSSPAGVRRHALDAERLPTPRADGDREALRILLGRPPGPDRGGHRADQPAGALLRDGDDGDRQLARGALTDAVLAGLARRRSPRDANRAGRAPGRDPAPRVGGARDRPRAHGQGRSCRPSSTSWPPG